MGLALIVAAAVFAASVGVMSHIDPAGACTDQNHSSVEVVDSKAPGGKFTKSQLHALQCMGMPAVIPTKDVPGLGAADPNVAVSAHGMMYNVTWKSPDGRTASLMIDHQLGSKLDMATSNRSINLGHGVTGYLTDYGEGTISDGQALELAWRDPRTNMWYKINGLPPKEAIAFYHTLRPVDLAHAG
jgi:hypothetical protein